MATKVKLVADGVITPDQITLTTASTGTNTTAPATTAFVQQEISALVDSSPDALNTLNELAAALGDDANFSTTVTNSIATKLPLAGGTLTGALTLTADANPALEISRGSANTTNVNLKYNTTLTGQLSAANAEFQISAAGSSTPMEFFTNGSERMRIDASGNVGIGTDSPDDKLHIRSTAQLGAGLRLENSNTSTDANTVYGTINFEGNDASGGASGIRGSIVGGSDGTTGAMSLEFSTASAGGSNTERMRIASSGNVGIGVSTPQGTLHIADPTTNTNSELLIGYQGTDAGGNVLGSIWFGSAESSGYRAAGIKSTASQDFNANDTPADLSFWTTNDNTTGATQKMVITDAGNVGIGCTPTGFATEIQATSGGNALKLRGRSAGGNEGWLAWTDNSDNVEAAMYATANNLIFANTTSYTERMRITDGGDVSIGSDHAGFSGWRVLNLRGEAGAGALVNWEGNDATRKAAIAQSGSDLRLQVFDTGSITFEPGTGTERMRIDSDGHVIVGSNISTTESGKFNVYTDATNDAAIYGYRSTSSFKIVPFLSNGAFSSLSNVNDSGLFFSDNFVIAKHATGYYGMIVTGNGSVHIGTESEANGSTGGVSFSADNNNRRNLICATTGTGSLELIEFRNPNGTVGDIKSNGTSTSYNTSSDYRLKENVTYEFNALDRVAQLKPARFNFITDEDTVLDGFLAHEVSDIVPEAVSGEKDATKEKEVEVTPAQYEDDGETLISEAVMETRTVPVYQSIDHSKLVPLLTKAIQELKTELDAAKARITELEG